MLIGLIRPRGTHTAEVTGTSLEDVQAQLQALAPTGYDLVNAPARMVKGAALIKTSATYQRRDDVREIEAEDMQALEAQMPEGWQLLSVRRV